MRDEDDPPPQPSADRRSEEGAGLLAFRAEGEAEETDTAPEGPIRTAPARDGDTGLSRQGWLYFAALTALGVVVAGGFVAYPRLASGSLLRVRASAPVGMGTAMVDAHPAGTVTIDGVLRGSTPLVVSLSAGTHTMEVAAGEASRSLPLVIEAGSTIKQDVEFAAAPTPARATGQLDIKSDPPGAQVRVDGVARGVTPLKLPAMTPGDHDVVLSRGSATIHQTVNIESGATASIAGVMTEATSAGWVSFHAPVALDILEDGQTIGTTSAARLMLPAGTHRVELRNAAFEIGTTLSVQVLADKTINVNVPVPNGQLSINATPWANVFVDGQDMGSTPLANLSVAVGRHEVIWRNPAHGERRRTVDVTARSPVRVGMDFSQ